MKELFNQDMVPQLDFVIDGLVSNMEQYVKRGNVKQYILDKNNTYIEILTRFRNAFVELSSNVNIHIMFDLVKQIDELERRDPELTGHIIKLCKRPGNKLSYIIKCY